jgi:hypothetical protein
LIRLSKHQIAKEALRCRFTDAFVFISYSLALVDANHNETELLLDVGLLHVVLLLYASDDPWGLRHLALVTYYSKYPLLRSMVLIMFV